jgi:prolyl-tRNA synthetase
MHKEGVLEKCREIAASLSPFFRVRLDDTDNSAGWKFAEYEMKGVPVRIEIGPKDIEAGQCVLVTRHNREKTVVSLDGLNNAVSEKLAEVRDGLYQKALKNREKRTYVCKNTDEIIAALKDNGDGFVKAMWCGGEDCENSVKEQTGAGSRCIPFEQEKVSELCVCCQKPARTLVIWGKAY